ncbi:MAG: hypothetical protein ACRCZF_24645, partial [Gemmataceae bacterium]
CQGRHLPPPQWQFDPDAATDLQYFGRIHRISLRRKTMRMEDIRRLTRAIPFVPFRVFLTNGENYDIWHPDMISVSLGAAGIASSGMTSVGDAAESIRLVSLIHIVKIEQLQTPHGVVSNSEDPSFT